MHSSHLKNIDEVEKSKKEQAQRNYAKMFTSDIMSSAIKSNFYFYFRIRKPIDGRN